MDKKHFIGKRVSSLETYSPVGPITGVALIVDENNEYMAGDDSGYVMEIECPYGTQAMADALLESLAGNTYRGYRADAAELDSEAELGDGVTLGDVYSMLAYRSVGFGPGHMSGIAAPCENELEHEYPYKSQAERQIERKIATTRSMITKTAEEIRLEVSSELDSLSSSIDVKLGSITSTVQGIDGRVATVEQTASGLTSTVQGLNGQISTLDQKIDSISLSVTNGESSSTITLTVDGVQVASKKIQFTGDVVFASDLTDGQTTISGNNILTGTIETARIKLSGKMKVYDDNDNIGGYIGYMAGADLSGSSTDGIAIKNGSNIIIATDSGVRMTGPSAEVVCVNNVTLDSAYSVVVDATNFKSNVSLTVTSDRNLKDDILYDIADKYLPLFDLLSPASFLYKGRPTGRHLGFIAQDVEVAAAECGIDKSDLALLVQDEDGLYGLSYSEFIPILVAKIKDLETRLEGLIA